MSRKEENVKAALHCHVMSKRQLAGFWEVGLVACNRLWQMGRTVLSRRAEAVAFKAFHSSDKESKRTV